MTRLKDIMKLAEVKTRTADSKLDAIIELRDDASSGIAKEEYSLNGREHVFTTYRDVDKKRLEMTTDEDHLETDCTKINIKGNSDSPAKDFGGVHFDFTMDHHDDPNKLYQMMHRTGLAHHSASDFKVYFESKTQFIELIPRPDREGEVYEIKENASSGTTYVEQVIGKLPPSGDRSIIFEYYDNNENKGGVGISNNRPKGKVVIIYSDGGGGGGDIQIE